MSYDSDDAGADELHAESGPSLADARGRSPVDEARPPDPGPESTTEPYDDTLDADEAHGAFFEAVATDKCREIPIAIERPDPDQVDFALSEAGSFVDAEDEPAWDQDDRPNPPVMERCRVAGPILSASGRSRPSEGPTSRATRGHPPSRREVRSPRYARLPGGFRRRSKRGDGRRRHVIRAFPPRSPP